MKTNALEQAKQLIAGRVDYDVLCRHAAHNLSERNQVQQALKQPRLSKPRVSFLKGRLRDLLIEKSIIETKERRIRPHVSSEHLFII